MRLIFFSVLTMVFIACNSGNKSPENGDTSSHDHLDMDSSAKASTEKLNAPVIRASFSGVSADVVAHINVVLGHYSHIAHALTKDDAREAKDGATMLLQVISQFDQSLLPPEQKAEYTKHVGAINQYADAMVKSSDVASVRISFSELSTQLYTLLKAFGAGKKIYYDRCPMAFDNKGASWISENAVVQNPYLGTKMPDCGSVEQIIE